MFPYMLPLLPPVIAYFPCSSWSSGFFGLAFCCSCCCLFVFCFLFFIQAAIKAPLLFGPILSSTLHATKKKAKYQFPPCNVIIFASSVVHLKKQMFNLYLVATKSYPNRTPNHISCLRQVIPCNIFHL